MTLKTILRDDEYCSDIRSKKSPIHISKKEIEKMTIHQLKDVLQQCDEKRSGNKNDLVNRVYRKCKKELVSRVKKSCSRRRSRKSPPPVINFPLYDDSSSSSCGRRPCDVTDLSRKQIINALRRIGISHERKNLSIDALNDIYNAPRCNLENSQYCPDDQYCDLRDKVCTSPDYAVSKGVVQAELNGHKVIGSVDMISNLADKLNISCDKSKWVRLPGINSYQCKGDNYMWQVGQGCYGRINPQPTCSSSTVETSTSTSVPSTQTLLAIDTDKFAVSESIDNVVSGNLETPPPLTFVSENKGSLGLNTFLNVKKRTEPTAFMFF